MAICANGHSYDGSYSVDCPACPANMDDVKTEVMASSPVTITDWVDACHLNSKNHGFHNDMEDLLELIPSKFKARVMQLFVTEKIALIHSEGSEALEDVRDGKMEMRETSSFDNAPRKPIGFPSELADVVIRCFDLAGMLDINLEEAILIKHEYNKSRPIKHGKKF